MAGKEQPNGPRTHLLDSVLPIIQRPTTPAIATVQYDPSHEGSRRQSGRDRVDRVLAWESLSENYLDARELWHSCWMQTVCKTMDKATS